MSDTPNNAPKKLRVATAWLDGCSGCHMSFLDMDERLIELADRIDLVYSPIMDAKIFPEEVDLAIVEGAISTEDDLELIKEIRRRSKVLISLGDCAVTGNVPSMRNPFGTGNVLRRVYPQVIPSEIVPALLSKVCPIHTVVHVDVYLPGCPPSADAIYETINDLLDGRQPKPNRSRFGA